MATPPATYPVSEDNELSLRRLFGILKKRWPIFVLTFGGVFGVVAFSTFTATPIFQATGTILIQRQNQAGVLSGLGEIAELGNLNNTSNPLPTQISILSSNVVLKQTIQDLNTKFGDSSDPSLTLGGLRGSIDVTAIPQTDLISVSFRDADPKRAVIVVNQLMENFVDRSIDISRGQKRAVREFIESQIPVAQNNFEVALEKLQIFRDQRNIIDISAQSSNLINEITNLERQILDTQVQLSRLNQSQSRLVRLLGTTYAESSTIATLSQSPGIQVAIASIQATQAELDKARSRYTASHPSIQTLERQLTEQQQTLNQRINQLVDGQVKVSMAEVANLQRGQINLDLIKEQITNDILIDTLQKQLRDLTQAYQRRQVIAAELPKIERELVRLQVDVETTQTRFTSLLRALQDARISENQDVGNVVITQPADEAIGPVSPRVVNNLIMGALLGVVFGITAVLLAEYTDRTLRTPADLQQVFPELNRIGFVPNFYGIRRKSAPNAHDWSLQDSNVFEYEPIALVQESYRMLFANIRYSNLDETLKVLAITSCMQGEGKSTTTVNLALAIAELGLKVLILDMDLRLPSQHNFWQVSNEYGLTSLFVDEVQLNKVVQNHNSQIDIITTGPIPPSPLQLVESKRFNEFIAYMRKHYDYILMDLPPLSVATESVTLSKIADGTLLVARLGLLRRPSALNVKEVFLPSLKNVIGLVMNGLTFDDNQGYYYYYQKDKRPQNLQARVLNLLSKQRR